MKNLRTAGVLFCVLLVLGAIASWDEWKTEQESEDARTKNPLLTMDFSNISEIRYRRIGEVDDEEPVSFVLRKDDGWWIEEPVNKRADQQAVENFIKAIQDYRYQDVVSSDPSKHDEFGVGRNPTREITLVAGEDRKTFLVGSQTPIAYQAYVRLADANEVFVGGQHVRVFTHKTLFDFRDKAVISVDFSHLSSVTIEARDKDTVRIVRSENTWKLTHPEETPADGGEVKEFINALAMSRAAGFYDTVTAAMRADFANPNYRITFVSNKDDYLDLSIINHGGKLVGSYGVDQGAFELPDNLRPELARTIFEFRELRVLKLDANEIARVEIDGDSYTRRDGLWYNTENKEATHLHALVVDLEFAKAEAFLPFSDPLAEVLSKPPLHRLKFGDSDKQIVIDLYPHQSSPSSYLVKRHGASELYQIPIKEFEGMKPLTTSDEMPLENAVSGSEEDQNW